MDIFPTISFSISRLYIGLCLLIIFYLLIYYIKNPTEALVPYNFVIENLYEKKVFYSEQEKKQIFPTSILLEQNWEKIRDEFLNLKMSENNIGKRFIKIWEL